MPLINLPLELFEEILMYLDLRTIWSLRLVNRSFKEACNGPPWLRFLTHLTTRVSNENLSSLERMISSYNLKRSVRELTILAPYPAQLFARRESSENPDLPSESITRVLFTEAVPAVPRDMNWLLTHGWADTPEARKYATVHRLASILSRLENLDTVNFQIDITEEDGMVRQCPLVVLLPEVHLMALMAMAQSNTPVSTLNFFRGPLPTILLYRDFKYAESQYSYELGIIGERLESLILNISAKSGVNLNIPDDTTGLARFLQFTPHLRQLDLEIGHASYYADTNNAIFVAVANDVYLPRLEECRLSGFWLEDHGSISKFFTRHSRTLQRVYLYEIDIAEGSWHFALRGFRSREAFPAFRYARLKSLTERDGDTYGPTTFIMRNESRVTEERAE